jgi:hypothetical protein
LLAFRGINQKTDKKKHFRIRQRSKKKKEKDKTNKRGKGGIHSNQRINGDTRWKQINQKGILL